MLVSAVLPRTRLSQIKLSLAVLTQRWWRAPVSVTLVSIIAASFMVVAGNAALWQTVQGLMPFSLKTASFWVAEAVLLFALTHVLIALFGFRGLFKPALTVLFFTTAFAGYFMSAYGTVIDSTMIRNVIETDVHEATELLTVRLVLYVLLIGLLPSLLLSRVTVRYPKFRRQMLNQFLAVAASVLVAALALASHYKDFSLMGREHKALRMQMNPLYPLYSVSRQAFSGVARPTVVKPIGEDSHRVVTAPSTKRKMIMVLVVGETARAANFSLNGYARDTNPELTKLPLINFANTVSCGTSTAVSVRCMFSDLGRAHFDEQTADSQQGVLDVLSRAGVSVLWRDNNSGCKGACDRVAVQKLDQAKLPGICNAEECFDEVLLSDLQQQLDAASSDALIVLHQKGSHGPAYYKRTPPAYKRFLPECTDANVQNCDRQSIVNSYDNTILYTDHVLASLVSLLKKNTDRYDTAMIYVSDHGESLGENSLYLHGLPYMMAPAEQTHVPMLMWLSDRFDRRLQLDSQCMMKEARQPASHDNLFHSLLGAFDVQSKVYDRKQDLFAGCRSGAVNLNMATRNDQVNQIVPRHG